MYGFIYYLVYSKILIEETAGLVDMPELISEVMV